MKMVKSLVLGSAAGLVAMTGAQAADLPVKAKAVEYVRICSLYGAGFFYIPGTDTCIKLGGYMRIDTTFNGNGTQDQPAWVGDSGQGNRYHNNFTTRSRMAFTVDTRTATEYGVVRTFGQADFQFDTLGNASFNPTVLATNLGNNANLLNSAGGGYTAVEFLFIQFAGFTFGKSASAYSTPWHGYPGNNSSNLIGGQDTVTGTNNIQYTAQFGNGVSGTIGLDDPTVYNRTAVINLASLQANNTLSQLGTVGVAGTAAANAYGGVHAPDIVGNIRVDQAWGLFQISAAAHEVGASYNVLTGGVSNSLSEISGHPETKWGGAVMAALNIKNIPTGTGDDIKVDASYTKGDTKFVVATAGASPNFAMFSGSSAAGAYQSIGFAAPTDAVFLPTAAGGDGQLHLTEAWGLRGAFNHNWDAYWSSSLFGSASWVRYDDTAKANYCGAYTATNASVHSADYSCDPDFAVFQVGGITRWTPVKNLTFSAEVMYTRLDQSFTGSAVLAAAAPKPRAVYEFKDQDTVSFNIRAQRNF
jgi:hypothetical protein